MYRNKCHVMSPWFLTYWRFVSACTRYLLINLFIYICLFCKYTFWCMYVCVSDCQYFVIFRHTRHHFEANSKVIALSWFPLTITAKYSSQLWSYWLMTHKLCRKQDVIWHDFNFLKKIIVLYNIRFLLVKKSFSNCKHSSNYNAIGLK